MESLKFSIGLWPGGQEVKTSPFHGGNTGSIPVRVTKKSRFEAAFFILQGRRKEYVGQADRRRKFFCKNMPLHLTKRCPLHIIRIFIAGVSQP